MPPWCSTLPAPAHRGRPPAPEAPAHRRADPVRAQLGDRRQLTELTAAVKDLRPDLLICVDHEGGRVQRFRTDGFTALPAMRVLGEMWMKDPLGATDAATAAGHVLASELRACGVDLSFTPVLDLDHGGSSVIGDRAFHRDARVVTLLAKSLMHGLLRAGMAHCGKHLPGPRLRQGRQPHRRAGGQARSRPSWPTTPGPTSGSAPRSPA
jgi:beta-glucosidase-like glycosyl hydrolase